MKPISRPQQVKIHVLAGQLFGADDAAYREMLGGFKVQSSSELSFARAFLVIEHLEESLGVKGEKGKRGKVGRESVGRESAAHPAKPRPGKARAREGRASAEQLAEIRRRWDALSTALPHEREGALRKFLRRRFHVAAPEWLSLEEAQKALNGLKDMKSRKACSA
jgi:hypothetical protein